MYIYVCVHVKLLQSYPILWDHMDSRPPGSSVYGILRLWGSPGKKLEMVAMSSCSGSSRARDGNCILKSSALAGEFFTTSATWEVPPSPYPAASLSLSLSLTIYIYIYIYSRSNLKEKKIEYIGGIIEVVLGHWSRVLTPGVKNGIALLYLE